MQRPLAPGVSAELARERAALVSEVRYELRFEIPESAGTPVTGKATVRFKLKNAPEGGLALDFVSAAAVNEHLLLPPGSLKAGENAFSFGFTANDGPLNRRPEFLYTLLVPARARELFPCFDQPDLKARFALSLVVPSSWAALANSPGALTDGVWRFETTEPLSTYQFAFAAGLWTVVERGGVRVFHRESDPAKAEDGVEAVLRRGEAARKWMEDYTGVPMPYRKLDYAVVPGFQYGGMEHPGAVYLNARRIFLDAAATEDERLSRASLIAHEIAHLWFGDYVTMRWFDDVWLKEVYANFFADKIAAAEFADADHDLRFVLQNHAHAYEVDRTAGAHPIRQPLENLDGAGALYGPIVYRKSPVVMRQLEARLGPAGLRAGLREYLRRHRWGNASWDDLLAALAPHDAGDLRAWARAWLSEKGRPTLAASVSLAPDGKTSRVRVTRTGPHNWGQRLEVAYGTREGARGLPVACDCAFVDAPGGAGLEPPLWLLPDRRGLGYGRMALDAPTRAFLLKEVERVEEPATRGVAWLALWEDALDGLAAPEEFLDAIARSLAAERQELLLSRLLRWQRDFHWRFLTPACRAERGPRLEALLWSRVEAVKTPSLKKAFFKSWSQLAETPVAVARMTRVWRREERVAGLALDEDEETALALELAVRGVDVLGEQAARLRGDDRRARLEFLRPAALGDQSWFVPRRATEGRRPESWVEDGLRLLNHPLRAERALALLPEALRLLPEVQRTGDIFFPSAWLEAVLWGHGDPRAAAAAEAFLAAEGSRLDPRLRALCEARFDALRAAARARG